MIYSVIFCILVILFVFKIYINMMLPYEIIKLNKISKNQGISVGFYFLSDFVLIVTLFILMWIGYNYNLIGYNKYIYLIPLIVVIFSYAYCFIILLFNDFLDRFKK
jgi:hypothetical protein